VHVEYILHTVHNMCAYELLIVLQYAYYSLVCILLCILLEERVLESRMILLQYFSTSRVRVLASTTVVLSSIDNTSVLASS